MKIHPYAEIFPTLEGAEFEALCDDIRANGQIEPIKLLRNQILDGRNRYNACKAIGVVPKYKDVFPADALQYVLSLNLSRRHLNESQRAMVATKLANLKEGRPLKTTEISAVSQTKAAELLNVSTDSVQFAKKVTEQGTEELRDKVTSGQITVSAASQIATLPHEEQKELLNNFNEKDILIKAKEIRQAKQTENRAKRIDAIIHTSELNGNKKFAVIYADPAWKYDFSLDNADKIENHYPTMQIEEICAIPVGKIASENCILFLWTTSPKLEQAFQVIRSWGFEYKTCAVWDKEWIAMGYYFRQQHELLLVSTKGEIPAPLSEARPPSVIRAKRTEHSRKPEIVYEIIEKMYPGLPKIELFARNKRENWESWGNEIGSSWNA